jgi:transcriptional regulator with XRE-family HTH domain
MTPEEIRVKRAAKGWSQMTLAARAGLHVQTIGLLERGASVHPITIAKIEAALRGEGGTMSNQTFEQHDAREEQRDRVAKIAKSIEATRRRGAHLDAGTEALAKVQDAQRRIREEVRSLSGPPHLVKLAKNRRHSIAKAALPDLETKAQAGVEAAEAAGRALVAAANRNAAQPELEELDGAHRAACDRARAAVAEVIRTQLEVEATTTGVDAEVAATAVRSWTKALVGIGTLSTDA